MALYTAYNNRDTAPSPPAATNGSAETPATASTPTAGAASAPTTNATSSGASPAVDNTTAGIFKRERERILCLPFKNGASASGSTFDGSQAEIIDIVNDYPWILDGVVGEGSTVKISSVRTGVQENGLISGSWTRGGNMEDGSYSVDGKNGGYSKKTKIPVCYMVERKNAVNGSITTILGMLGALDQIANGVQSISKDVENALANTGSAIGAGAGKFVGMMGDMGGDMLHAFKNIMGKLLGKIFPKLAVLQQSNNLNDEILNPYRFLYFTQDTKKRYVFPLTNADAASFLPTKLQWKDAKIEAPSIVGKAIKGAVDFLTSGAKFTTMLSNVTQLADENKSSDDIGSVNEAAKSFQYPTSGDQLKLDFTLYNTTRKNAWKDNYRFLFLFAVRNSPFRLEMFSFVPPLLYDIIIPGIKRMPISALTQMKVTPVGTIRVLTMENFIAGEKTGQSQNNTIQVSVPEAWQVQLTFQSLIAPAANLLLATVIGKLGIQSTSLSGDVKLNNAERAALGERLANTDVSDLHKLCDKIKKAETYEAGWKQVKTVRNIGAGEGLFFYADAAWNSKASHAEEDRGITMTLKTFGIEAEWKDGHVTDKSIIQAADLLIENGYAELNPDWKEGDHPWDKIKRKSDGKINNANTKPKLLNDNQAANFIQGAANAGISEYKDPEKAWDTLGVQGAQSIAKQHSTDAVNKPYSSYITPDGKPLSTADVNFFLPKKGGDAKEAAGSTFNYWQKTYNTHPEDYLTPEDQDKARAEINAYNAANQQLEDDKNAENGSNNNNNNNNNAGDNAGSATKVTPVCDSVTK